MGGIDHDLYRLKFLLDDWNNGFDELEASMSNPDADPNFDDDEVIKALRRRHYKTKPGRSKK
jgi:hypothetical protein